MTMYEILTRQLPYSEEFDNAVVENHISKGIRPYISPSSTPQILIKAIEMCWKPSPSLRPSAKELLNLVSESKSFS